MDKLLLGKQIVVTRSEDRAGGLAERLRALGAVPIVYPTIAFAPPEDLAPLDTALARLLEGAYDWLVLTSITAVQVVAERLQVLNSGSFDYAVREPVERQGRQWTDVRLPSSIAAVGPTTATACAELLGVNAAAIPEKFEGSALPAALGELSGKRILLPNADIARPTLERMLRTAGAEVERVIAYCTVTASGGNVDMPALLADGVVDMITFTSGSTARGFVERIGPAGLEYARRAVIACIGPSTAEAAREAGLEPTLVAESFTEEGLVEALCRYAATTRAYIDKGAADGPLSD